MRCFQKTIRQETFAIIKAFSQQHTIFTSVAKAGCVWNGFVLDKLFMCLYKIIQLRKSERFQEKSYKP